MKESSLAAEGYPVSRVLIMIVRWFGFAIALAATPTAVLAQNLTRPSAPSTVMETYCVSCHSGPARAGGFSLDRIDAKDPAKDVEAWERLVRQLRAHAMPVLGAARPDGKTYESTISALTDAMDRVAVAGKPLTELEVASRLARLVWNTEPDRPLLDAAAKGQLHDTGVLQTHVRRMLADSRSSALVIGFFSTWLSLDQLTTMKRDSGLFPEFDDELRSAMQRETVLFIESQLREDRSPLAFLNLLAEKLLAYADGGPLATDKVTPATRMPIVRSVLRESKVQNYSWSSLIAAIARAPSEGR